MGERENDWKFWSTCRIPGFLSAKGPKGQVRWIAGSAQFQLPCSYCPLWRPSLLPSWPLPRTKGPTRGNQQEPFHIVPNWSCFCEHMGPSIGPLRDSKAKHHENTMVLESCLRVPPPLAPYTKAKPTELVVYHFANQLWWKLNLGDRKHDTHWCPPTPYQDEGSGRKKWPARRCFCWNDLGWPWMTNDHGKHWQTDLLIYCRTSRTCRHQHMSKYTPIKEWTHKIPYVLWAFHSHFTHFRA